LLKMLTHSARRCVIILWFTSLEYCWLLINAVV
jgi:hypothetical protein